ncbi:hypothetical protein ACOME3_002935 [Neoechinorhynchus agilis]
MKFEHHLCDFRFMTAVSAFIRELDEDVATDAADVGSDDNIESCETTQSERETDTEPEEKEGDHEEKDKNVVDTDKNTKSQNLPSSPPLTEEPASFIRGRFQVFVKRDDGSSTVQSSTDVEEVSGNDGVTDSIQLKHGPTTAPSVEGFRRRSISEASGLTNLKSILKKTASVDMAEQNSEENRTSVDKVKKKVSFYEMVERKFYRSDKQYNSSKSKSKKKRKASKSRKISLSSEDEAKDQEEEGNFTVLQKPDSEEPKLTSKHTDFDIDELRLKVAAIFATPIYKEQQHDIHE